jgi:ADP-dependent phosphofructokinase/glucokinase
MRLSDETKRKISEANKSKTISEEQKRKISEAQKGEKSNHWKDYARIIKAGTTSYGKPNYTIRFNGKQIKYSIFPEKLKKWFNENYPNEELKIGGDIIAE